MQLDIKKIGKNIQSLYFKKMKKIFIVFYNISFINSILPRFFFERFIPLELFTGGKIRNDTEIKFTNANLVFGEKKKRKL